MILVTGWRKEARKHLSLGYRHAEQGGVFGAPSTEVVRRAVEGRV
jgi:hypothetical protein